MYIKRLTSRWAAGLLFFLVAFQSSGRADDRPAIVSLVALIANPQAYAAQKVLVAGFCGLEFEGTAVYLHEEDYRRSMTPNSIWLDVEPTRPDKPNPIHERYCVIEALFNAKPARNGRAGRLVQVTRLELLPSRAELAAELKE